MFQIRKQNNLYQYISELYTNQISQETPRPQDMAHSATTPPWRRGDRMCQQEH